MLLQATPLEEIYRQPPISGLNPQTVENGASPQLQAPTLYPRGLTTKDRPQPLFLILNTSGLNPWVPKGG